MEVFSALVKVVVLYTVLLIVSALLLAPFTVLIAVAGFYLLPWRQFLEPYVLKAIQRIKNE